MRNLILSIVLSASAFAQGTAKFPGAIPTHQDLPIAVNNGETQLTSTITTNSRSFTVLDPNKFKVPTYITITGPAPDYANREIILICDKQSNTLVTCPNGRGVDASMPAAYHKYGDTVAALVVAEYVNHLSNELIAQATALGVNLANVIKTGQAASGDLGGEFPNPTVQTLKGGKPIPVGDVVGTSDEQLLTNKTVTGLFYGTLHGNADSSTTAVQFAADPQDCITGKYGFGINTKGDLNCKNVDWTEVASKPTSMPPSGAASGDLSGTYPSPTVSSVGGKTAAALASVVDMVNLGTDLNVINTIMKRNGSGGVSATTFTGALAGNANTASSLLTKPAGCVAGKFAVDIAKTGDLSCLQVQFANLGGTITLPSTGVAPGTYGSETKSTRVIVGADGRITSITELVIPGTDGSGYVTVKNGATALAQRSILQVTNGLTAADDAPNNTSSIGLSPSGVTAGTYGNAASIATVSVDAYGRVTAITSQGVSIDASQIASGVIPLSRLSQSSLNTGNTLVTRDANGNFNAGTITAASFVGSLLGNASTASNVAWTGITGKPSIVLQDGGTYSINISGNSSTAASVPWSGISGKPANFVLNDGGLWGINIGGSAGSVPWSGVSGKPVNFVFNDGGTWSINVTGSASYSSTSGAATNWTGSHQMNWSFGDGTSQLFAMTNRMPVWRNRNFSSIGITGLTCRVDSGSVTVEVVGSAGQQMSTSTCGTSYTNLTLNGYANLNRWDEIQFRITGVSGTPTVVAFEGAYNVAY